MPSLPLTPDERKQMLGVIGAASIDDLFSSIPPSLRAKANIQFDGHHVQGMGEHDLRLYFGKLARKNAHDFTHFLGGGLYDNIIPAIVDQLVLRGEFLTCYTPYQPEVSQGTLQAIFEFQTMMARITGMEVSNASIYDGATSTAEAVLMAQRLYDTDRPVLFAASTHPEYLQVTNTFLKSRSAPPVLIPYGKDGTVDLKQLEALIAEHKPLAIVISYPNYFGVIEPLDKVRSLCPDDCTFIVSTPDLSVCSIYEPPGKYGADIVAGEAQQLGTPMLFGGPHVGFFTTRSKFLRQMPGRLCGETLDNRGQRAYTLTLSTREQHIRREKATSNICTNQGLIALRTTIYLSFLGKQGFTQLGTMNHSLYQYLEKCLLDVGIPKTFPDSHCYREGVFEVPHLDSRFEKALQRQMIPGIRLSEKFDNSKFQNSLLISTHPKLKKIDIDKLVEALSHD